MTDLLRTMGAYGVDLPSVMERFVNDEELYENCLMIFLEDPSFAGLEEALQAKDYGAAFEHAHSLKGVAGNLGLTPLFTVISAMVEALRGHAYGNLEHQRQEIRGEREKLKKLLGV